MRLLIPARPDDLPRRAPRRRGFSVTELLVVIGIIVLLVSLLLVALSGVRDAGRETKTLSIMTSFVTACETFQQDHQRAPGIVPERFLHEDPLISGTENALGELMGGFVDQDNPNYASYTAPDWIQKDFSDGNDIVRIKYNPRRMGEGPLIDGRTYGAYYTGELVAAEGQWNVATNMPEVPENPSPEQRRRMIPDLVDGWGQPIIYLRQIRSRGALVGQADDRPQFLAGGMEPYLASQRLGEMGLPQDKSILNQADDPDATLAQIIRSPSLGAPDAPVDEGVARGGFVLISAGSDGIYFSVEDGPGTRESPVDDIVSGGEFATPTVIEEYDDVITAGGG